MAKDDNFVSVVDVGLQQSLLLEWRAIHQVDILESRDLVPDLGVDVVLVLLFLGFSSNDDNDLQLELLHVLGSKRHDELLDRTVNAANHDMVLHVWIVLEV